MLLEDYFDFNTEPVEHIRIKGTRIDIDFVIELYQRHMIPEQIAVYFGCPITVEQAYATITYYLHNKTEVDAYLKRREAIGEANYQNWLARPPSPAADRIRALKAAKAAEAGAGVTPVEFLLDEHVPVDVISALAGLEPAIRVVAVGQPGAPPKQTSDPGVLVFAEQARLAVVTFDKATMPDHVVAHQAAGRHTWGVFIFRNGNQLSAGRIAEELLMIWAASDRDEWIDRVEYLPYRA